MWWWRSKESALVTLVLGVIYDEESGEYLDIIPEYENCGNRLCYTKDLNDSYMCNFQTYFDLQIKEGYHAEARYGETIYTESG